MLLAVSRHFESEFGRLLSAQTLAVRLLPFVDRGSLLDLNQLFILCLEVMPVMMTQTFSP